MSKTYSMAGWRIGFAAGNKTLIQALTRIKSYLDYGTFQPIQIASIVAWAGGRTSRRPSTSISRVRRRLRASAKAMAAAWRRSSGQASSTLRPAPRSTW